MERVPAPPPRLSKPEPVGNLDRREAPARGPQGARGLPWPGLGLRAASCGHFASVAARRRGRVESGLAFWAARWHIAAARQRDRFAFPPPSLGVSSLDLGRLHPRAALFLRMFSAGSPAGRSWRAEARGTTASPEHRPCANWDAAMRYGVVRDRRHSAAAR